MSTVAKVFVVLNLLLAGLFLGSAAAMLGHSDNWKTRFDDQGKVLQKSQADLREEQQKHTTEVDALAKDKNASDEAAKRAKAEADTLRNNLEATVKNHNDQAAALAAATRALQVANSTIQNDRNQNEVLAKERAELIKSLADARTQLEAAVRGSNAAEQNLQDLMTSNKATEATLAQTKTELQRTQFELEQYKRMYPNGGPGSEQPMQAGKVLQVDNEANIVVISLGSDDGVKVGFRYTVSRGASYVAQIEVTSVEPKQSGARIDRRVSKGPVSPGDDIRTATPR